MTVKQCNRCKEEKFVSEFNKKGNRLQPYCRPCDNLHSKEYYEKNKEKVKKQIYAARKIRVGNIKEQIRSLKETTPCADCGMSYPYYVMDFDHLGDDKEYNIAGMAEWASIETINKEIDKCEIVCSNCHRKRTYERRIRA